MSFSNMTKTHQDNRHCKPVFNAFVRNSAYYRHRPISKHSEKDTLSRKNHISKKPNDNVEQLKRAGIEDKTTLFFAACNSDEQSLARMYIERLRLQKQKSGKSLTELAVTSDREQLPEDDEINEDIYPRRIKNFERRKLKLEKEFDEREEIPTSIKKLRFVTEKPNEDEKSFVRNEYHTRCQLCGSDGILTAKDKRYFEAVNIFKTAQLDESLKIKLVLLINIYLLCKSQFKK